MNPSLRIATGSVFHSRLLPRPNNFNYPIFYLWFDLAEENELRTELRRRFPCFSLRTSDYLNSQSGSLADSARAFLENNCAYKAEKIELITMPRIFGYGFNPINFWLCYREGKLAAALCEVNNTFGERHFYWLSENQMHSGEAILAKHFHVSPFFSVSGNYHFKFQVNPAEVKIYIEYQTSAKSPLLHTALTLSAQPLNSYNQIILLLRYGWASLMVTTRIHLQAIRLWWKGAPFFHKPAPPHRKVSL